MLAKPVDDFINEGRVNYSGITEIYFWGFSLSDVDKPYIDKILDDNKSTIKNIYLCNYQFKNERDLKKYKDYLKSQNIDIELQLFDDSLINWSDSIWKVSSVSFFNLIYYKNFTYEAKIACK